MSKPSPKVHHEIVGAPLDDPEVQELLQLTTAANDGDPAALAGLRKHLDERPYLWRINGDMATRGEEAWVRVIAGPDILERECIQRKMRELRRELRGETPTPLERLLVDRIVACWLALGFAEAAYPDRLGGEGISLKHGEYLQERVDRAQRRYLASIKALAQLRRLQRPPRPTVQVTIADKQINVVAPPDPEPAQVVVYAPEQGYQTYQAERRRSKLWG